MKDDGIVPKCSLDKVTTEGGQEDQLSHQRQWICPLQGPCQDQALASCLPPHRHYLALRPSLCRIEVGLTGILGVACGP